MVRTFKNKIKLQNIEAGSEWIYYEKNADGSKGYLAYKKQPHRIVFYNEDIISEFFEETNKQLTLFN